MAEHQIYIQTGRHLFFYYSDHVTEVIKRRLVVMQQLSVTRRGRPRAGSHRRLMSSVSLQASYGVEDPEYAVTQLAQTTMRSELGKLTLDKVFRVRNMCALTLQQKKGKRCVCVYLELVASVDFKERESLNSNMVHSINQASAEWGIRCLRYEIKDIQVPPRVKDSMQMQVRRITF